MSKRGKTDWYAVKQAFVSSSLSYAAVAERFGLSKTTVYRKARAENWRAKRQEYQNTALNTQAELQARSMTEGMSQCIRTAKAILERLEDVIDEKEDITPREYYSMSVTIKNIVDIITSDLDIEKRRMDIEKIRKELEDQQDNNLTITIAPELEPYCN